MKILVSSKGFSDWLKSINISIHSDVNCLSLTDGKLSLFRGTHQATLFVESKDNNCEVDQNNVRWDWLYRDLRGIQEQPIVIEFLDNKATFTLTY